MKSPKCILLSFIFYIQLISCIYNALSFDTNHIHCIRMTNLRVSNDTYRYNGTRVQPHAPEFLSIKSLK